MSRPTHTYTLPKSLGGNVIGIVELTAEEELMAAKRCGNDPIRLTFELAKESFQLMDGRRISSVDGSIDAVWQGMHPQARNLVVRAFSNIHNPSDTDAQAFLQSRQTQV